ncbi:hypothetical protein APE_2021a [Aeropyrum pernix K1]|uniref:Uncharacterized protein n=2 Tax=Aeropyrum pernix TaxID=56636 RepID=Q05DY7_AERPE|nr:hypothetical protein [Aeropyrum pernix]BAF34814.1 hypothetical protein APE_2021a [Aeropyrum pernix K1]GBF09158.1 hypothetical protein apy_08830 [Aeropyrum pernix]
MPRRVEKSYRCDNPPCIHVVVDSRRKIFKVFLEDYNVIAPIPFDKVIAACEDVKTLKNLVENEGFREAEAEDVDMLARKYLGAEPYEEEIET